MRVAVVSNSGPARVLRRFGLPSPERYGRATISAVAQALLGHGHDVVEVPGDARLLPTLAAFFGERPGFAFNLAYGVQGESRYAHVPAFLEMAGVPYTGSAPLGHALSLDKVVTKTVIADAGANLSRLRFPVVVKPRHESTSNGLRLAYTPEEAADAVAEAVATFRQAALVEEYVAGREVSVSLLGNGDGLEVLPVVELDFGERPGRLVTREDKFHRVPDEPARICPAPIDDLLLERLRRSATQTFLACHCRDYARVDIRIDDRGVPHVLEINSMASLSPNGTFAAAAQAAGYDYPAMVQQVLSVARARAGTDLPDTDQVDVAEPAEDLAVTG